MADGPQTQAVKQSEQPCACGCGRMTLINDATNMRKGRPLGSPNDYIHGHATRKRGPEYTVDERGCWIWQRALDKDGYGRLHVAGEGTKRAHRVYYKRFVGAIPTGYHLHHVCETRACVNPEHLTPLEPTPHAWTYSTTRLSPADARDIRRIRAETGLSHTALARWYGVDRKTIAALLHGRTWTYAQQH